MNREHLAKKFFKENKGKFRKKHQKEVSTLLHTMDQKTFDAVTQEGFDDPSFVLFTSVLVGYVGIDRFLLGHSVIGMLKLITTLVLISLSYILNVFIFHGESPATEITWWITFSIIATYWIAGIIRVNFEVKNHNFQKLKQIIANTEAFS